MLYQKFNDVHCTMPDYITGIIIKNKMVMFLNKSSNQDYQSLKSATL